MGLLDTAQLYNASCDFACWRNASGYGLSTAHKRFGEAEWCNLKRCGCGWRGDPFAKQWLPLASASVGRLTHVVVVAARWNADPDRMVWTLRKLSNGWRRYLPRNRSAVVIVDNLSPLAVGDQLRAECSGVRVVYTRNKDHAYGRGFELGAWRWAMRHVLPGLNMRDDTILYFTQDSLSLNRHALRYPPPHSFEAAALLSFDYEAAKIRGLSAEQTYERLRITVSRLQELPPSAQEALRDDRPSGNRTAAGARTKMYGCFGPNMVSTWSYARALENRGFFDLINATVKADEELAERAIGWLMSRGAVGLPSCSVSGNYYRNFVLPWPNRIDYHQRAFNKVFNNRTD